jgi:osomolarity two-component system sensor histidine kinase SLN1
VQEVRVPLNTALLAFQNMVAAEIFDKVGDQSIEYNALEGSLIMMQKGNEPVLSVYLRSRILTSVVAWHSPQ